MPELVYPPNPVDVATENLKIAPQSIEAEQSVIGGLMLDKNAWDKIGDLVIEEDFYRRDHQLIFRAIADMSSRGDPCDVVTLSEWLNKQDLLNDAGGLAYLGTLAKNTPRLAIVLTRLRGEVVKNCWMALSVKSSKLPKWEPGPRKPLFLFEIC
jgi:replicative DNA helicase